MTRIALIRTILSIMCLLSAVQASAYTGLWSSAKDMTSSTITAIAQDRDGYVWVGTEYGLNRYDGYRYTYYLADAADSCTINDNEVTALYVDRSGNLWVGTRQGLNRYNPDTDKFTSVEFDCMWPPRIKQLCSAEDGSLWCATSGYGLWRIDGDRAIRVTASVPEPEDDYYHAIAFDGSGNLWKSNQRGELMRMQRDGETHHEVNLQYSPKLGDIISILPQRGDSIFFVFEFGVVSYDGNAFQTLADTRESMTIAAALIDSHGCLQLGTMTHGLWQYDRTQANSLQPCVCSMEEIDASAASVRALFCDKSGNVWAGCYQRGLLLLPADGLSYMSWSLSEDQRPTSSELTSVVDVNYRELLATLPGKGLFLLSSKNKSWPCPGLSDANCIYLDRHGRYWVATAQGVKSFDPATGVARMACPIPEASVRKMTSDKQGRIYVSNFARGMVMYDPQSGQTRRFDMYHPVSDDLADRLCNDWILDLLCDSRGNIWCATASGVSCYDPRGETFCPYGWNQLLTDHLCQCLAEDADGNILVGTNNGVFIYDLRTRQLHEALPGLGLMSRSVSSIVAMPDHTVWLSTSHGIWFYDPEVGNVQPCPHVEGPSSHEYNVGVGSLLQQGDIVFAHHDGIVVFDPQQARRAKYSPTPLILTAFVKDNEVVKPGVMSGSHPIYTCNVTQAHEFTLAYDDNSFVMEFSPMTFDLSCRSQVEYSIDGGRWQTVAGESNVIPFNHLQPGDYNLRVRALFHNVHSAESSYTIHVLPPWYASWWMNTLYVLLALVFAGTCLQVWLRHKRTQLEDEKMKLLIDATHDIRTPLTLILSPLHQLAERFQSDTDTSAKLKTIDHNARRILTLVNQILDVRRFDKQQMPYNPQPTDLVRLVGDNLQGFTFEAQQRNISLTYRHEMESPFNVSLDRTQFEKVIVNLVGNSFKFTPDGGEVELYLTTDGQNAVLKVSDTGVGLPEGETERIFHRFYQSANFQGGEGTGIGLNLCLKVMQQHGGTIAASARSDGRSGSVFTVTLPLPAVAEQPVIEQPVVAVATATTRQPSRSQRILLVDDDPEITAYIANEMSGRYHFQSCRNGLEALQLLLADPSRFDVLVSDIMMPEMDGLTLLRSIKSNSQIAHIPVVLLTSKTEISNRLEGLSAGADAYMAKPFVIDELRATIDTLIANTVRRRTKFTGSLEAAKASAEQAADAVKSSMGSDSDSKMLERIIKVVNEHLSEADFGVDELCQEVGISRSQLHRKMKDLTGIGAGEFVRNIRLEQAARLLKETDMNVSQVAYAVGFSNLGHFSKIFRTHFGAYPSDYGAQ